MLLLKKIINTFCYPKFLFSILISEKTYRDLANSNHDKSFLKKIFYFYPSVVDAKTWMEGGVGKYRNPDSFVKLRDDIDSYFIDYFSKNIEKEQTLLDLGCNSGRHLNALHKIGYEKLNGVDVMETALENFKKEFFVTYLISNLKSDFFQRYLDEAAENSFDCIYSIGATIELVHPSYDIIKAICRVASKNVVLLIQPDRHNYPRFYEYEFKRNGYSLKYKKQITESHFLFHFIKSR